jgi:hypothetical protein
VGGEVTASHGVLVLDLSLGGARVEHTMILRPGSSCYLRLPLNERLMTVNCGVIWSKAIGRAPGEQGATGLLYHSGVEFGRLGRDAQTLLTAYMETQGMLPGGRVSPD